MSGDNNIKEEMLEKEIHEECERQETEAEVDVELREETEEAEENDTGAEEGNGQVCLELLEQKNAQLTQQLLRLKADHENFRRRSREQMAELVLKANEELLLDLLPVLDNFERALKSKDCDADPFVQGVAMVQQGLLASLAKHGLEQIKAKGQPFNPVFHDAISMAGEGGDNLMVLEEVQTGYLLNGKVIRHTKVLVGQNEEEEKCQK